MGLSWCKGAVCDFGDGNFFSNFWSSEPEAVSLEALCQEICHSLMFVQLEVSLFLMNFFVTGELEVLTKCACPCSLKLSSAPGCLDQYNTSTVPLWHPPSPLNCIGQTGPAAETLVCKALCPIPRPVLSVPASTSHHEPSSCHSTRTSHNPISQLV